MADRGLTQRADGKWRLVISTGRGEDGRYHRRVKVVEARNITEARAAMTAFRVEVGAGPSGDNPTVKALSERWLLHLEARGRAPHTITGYRRHLRVHVLPRIGTVTVRALDHHDLDRVYAAMGRTHKRDGKGKATDHTLSPTTIRQVHAIIRSMLRQAVRWEMIDRSPTDRVELPAAVTRRSTTPSAGSAGAAITAAEAWGPDAVLFVRLAAATGMRRGELSALRWTDVDLEAATLTVARSMTRLPDFEGERPTKTRAERTIALDGATVTALQERRAQAREVARRLGSVMAEDGFVLSSAVDSSEPWPPDRMSHLWTRVRVRAGIPHARLHDLRHMHATELIDAGIPVTAVAARLGHASTTMTLNVYGKGTAHADTESARVIAERLAPPPAD